MIYHGAQRTFGRTFRSSILLLLWLLSAEGATAQLQPEFEMEIVDENDGKVLIADIDGDGDNDVLKRSSTGEALVLFEYLENGTLDKHVLIEDVRFRGDRIDAADVDGDGDLDLATAYTKGDSDESGFLAIWIENPLPDGDPSQKGTWEVREIGMQDGYVKDLALVDFDGDGRRDLVTRANELADMNGDGRLDLIVSEERYWGLEPNANLYWFQQPDDLTEEWPRNTVVTQYSMNNLDAADMDRDGDVDLLTNEHRMPRGDMAMPEIERTQIWENDGTGSFTKHDVDTGKESHLGSRAADLDGDGDLDIVSIAWRNYENLHLWRNDAVKGRARDGDEVSTSLRHFGTANGDIVAPYRFSIDVGAGGFARMHKVVTFDVNFTQKLEELGASGALDPASLRLVEVDARGKVIDPEVVFQFDTLDDFDPAERATGSLSFMLEGRTHRDATRRYRLYFGDEDAGEFEAQTFEPLVRVEDAGVYEGDETFKITTPSATYYYHKHGSGFASMLDPEGNDWISYHPEGGAEGNYRGIPNIAPAGFHPGPGEGNKPSNIVFDGPIRTRILSETKDEAWGAVWDIYPHTATMTLFKRGEEPYWILYEGTPGGKFDMTDYWVDSSGRRFDDMQAYEGPDNPWHGDLPGPEWVYFGDADLDRVLYYIHTPDDRAIDEFWNFGEGGMTVFGFGRGPRDQDGSGWQRLTEVPAQLTIGFADDSYREAARTIDGAYRPVVFSVGSAERVR